MCFPNFNWIWYQRKNIFFYKSLQWVETLLYYKLFINCGGVDLISMLTLIENLFSICESYERKLNNHQSKKHQEDILNITTIQCFFVSIKPNSQFRAVPIAIHPAQLFSWKKTCAGNPYNQFPPFMSYFLCNTSIVTGVITIYTKTTQLQLDNQLL